MLDNKLSKRQEDLFIDVYKTCLGSILGSKKVSNLDSMVINSAVDIAATIAMNSVELLMDKYEMKSMKDIKDKLINTRADKPLDYPEITD